jgi:hypothetical protein
MDVQELRTTMDADLADRPSGTWNAAPALAASTVAMTNNSGFPVVAGVSGGTVTVIKINGITITAATSGRFRMRNGDTLAITYSVAPTLQWLFE